MIKSREACNNCGKPATINIQKLWVKWKYDAEADEYSSQCELFDNIGTEEGENFHFCAKCAELWENGEV